MYLRKTDYYDEKEEKEGLTPTVPPYSFRTTAMCTFLMRNSLRRFQTDIESAMFDAFIHTEMVKKL